MATFAPLSRSEGQFVTGIARDSTSGRPAPGLWANARQQVTRRFVGGVRTDSMGRFSIKVPPADVYRVEFTMPDGTPLGIDSVRVESDANIVVPRTFAIPVMQAEARHMYLDSQVDRPVKVRKAVEPQYPPDLLESGAAGQVVIQIAVDSLGAAVPES